MENIDNIIDEEISTQDDTQDHKIEDIQPIDPTENGVKETEFPPKSIEKKKKPRTKAQQEAWAKCLKTRQEAVARKKKVKAKLDEKIKKIKKEPIVLSDDEKSSSSSSSEDEPEPIVIVKKKRKKIEKKKVAKVQYIYETDSEASEGEEPKRVPKKTKVASETSESEDDDEPIKSNNSYDNLDWRAKARLRGF